MARCGNCGKSLSCGCQKRKASDGASVCSNCVNNYEAKKINKTIRPLSKPEPQVWGPNRYNNQATQTQQQKWRTLKK